MLRLSIWFFDAAISARPKAPAPTTQAVRLQGLAPSDAIDDVKIRVKHTAADGAECEDMIELTVILATLIHSPCPPGMGKSRDVRPDRHWVSSEDILVANIIDVLNRWDDSPDLPTDSADRDGIIRSLERIAADEAKMYGIDALELYSPRVSAIQLLARFEAVESAPTLVDLVDFVVHDPWNGPHFTQRPAVRALVQIGVPTVAPILDRAASMTDEQWRAAASALRQIDKSSPRVRQLMRERLNAEAATDPPLDAVTRALREILKQRIEQFLSTPEPVRPAPSEDAVAEADTQRCCG